MVKTAKKTDPTTKFDLDFPFEWDGEIISHLDLKRPKGKHIKMLGENPTLSDLLGVASRISGYTHKVFDEMDGSDCLRLGETVAGFLSNGREIGANQ
jgi:hypothetical protein